MFREMPVSIHANLSSGTTDCEQSTVQYLVPVAQWGILHVPPPALYDPQAGTEPSEEFGFVSHPIVAHKDVSSNTGTAIQNLHQCTVLLITQADLVQSQC